MGHQENKSVFGGSLATYDFRQFSFLTSAFFCKRIKEISFLFLFPTTRIRKIEKKKKSCSKTILNATAPQKAKTAGSDVLSPFEEICPYSDPKNTFCSLARQCSLD